MTTGADSPAFAVADRASLSTRLAIYADALVRATAGLLLMPHGAQKLFGWFGGPGLAGAQEMFETKLGLPPWLAVVTGIIEFFGGLLLALGLGTRIVASLIAIQMFYAVFAVHWSNGFFWSKGGLEYPLFWGLVALSYALRGGGHCSLDAIVTKRRRQPLSRR